MLCGLDGEQTLPEAPFHGYDGPLSFGLADSDGEPSLLYVDGLFSAESLGTDTKFTLLPPGLLDSPPHQPSTSPPHVVQNLCNACIIPLLPPPTNAMTPDPVTVAATAIPPTPPSNVVALLHPTTEPSHHHIAATLAPPEVVALELVHAIDSLSVKRSVRLAARPAGSADPMTRACDMKIKKLGLTEEVEDVKVVKKHQLLQAYTGEAGDIAEATI
jgi:hypothetical protein